MAVALSPNRRVLGEKTTNASLNIHEHRDSIKEERQVADVANRIQLASPLRAGTKRRFQDLDFSSQESFTGSIGWQQRSRPSPVPEIEETDEELGLMSSMIESTSTSGSLSENTSTVLTSFHASQEPSQPIEEQFEIVQEESQQTLEQIHATPMPEPKASLLPSERPLLSTELSQDNVRMSSFIEFDETEQSQREKVDQDLEMIAEPQPIPCGEEERNAQHLLEKATMLRTRLQLAMHKVQTNQTSKPFSRLDKPTTTSPELSLPPRVFTANVVPPQPDSTSIRNSPESQIAANRARVFRGAYQIKPVQRLSAFPMPKIVPTAYSARYMSQAPKQQRHIPSSPPVSCERNVDIQTLINRKTRGTPSPHKSTCSKVRLPKTPMQQLSSPPGSIAGDTTTTGRRMNRTSRSALTSSVVKGEAANGLLELMRAASR